MATMTPATRRTRQVLSCLKTLCLPSTRRNLSSQVGVMDKCVYQVAQMKDLCCVVDENDRLLDSKTKQECHRRVDGDHGILHRAFSVFLFNSDNKLLLQQRSSSKITFPDYFTNTCCSHPRYNPEEISEELNEGVKIAARRRMEFELGIPENQLPLDDFKFLTKVHYSASSDDDWAESEIDHILFIKADPEININKSEVQHIQYVDQSELKALIDNAATQNILITPWFKFITDNFLYQWWEKIDSIDDQRNDTETIHRAGLIKT